MTEHRELQFGSLDEVTPEVDRLLTGYRKLGNWSLGQICNHLAVTMRMAVEPPAKPVPWILRKFVGPAIFRRMMRSGRMKAGARTPEFLVPRPGMDDRAEAESLRATIRLLRDQLPDPINHPFFGTVSRGDYLSLQCMHCADHLGFLIPSNGG